MPTIHLVDPRNSSATPEPQTFPTGSRLTDVVATFVTEKQKKKTPIAAVLGGKVVGLDSLLPEEEEPTVEFLLPVTRVPSSHATLGCPYYGTSRDAAFQRCRTGIWSDSR